jgi:hypothetical protein
MAFEDAVRRKYAKGLAPGADFPSNNSEALGSLAITEGWEGPAGFELAFQNDLSQKNSAENTSTFQPPQFMEQTFVTIPYKPGDPGDGGRGKM